MTKPAVVLSLSSGMAYPSLNSLFSPGPYSDYVGVNISLNNSSSLSFLNVFVDPISSSTTNSRTHSFPPSILPSARNHFILGTLIAITPSGIQKVFLNPVGMKYLIGIFSSDLLSLNDSDTTILIHR